MDEKNHISLDMLAPFLSYAVNKDLNVLNIFQNLMFIWDKGHSKILSLPEQSYRHPWITFYAYFTWNNFLTSNIDQQIIFSLFPSFSSATETHLSLNSPVSHHGDSHRHPPLMGTSFALMHWIHLTNTHLVIHILVSIAAVANHTFGNWQRCRWSISASAGQMSGETGPGPEPEALTRLRLWRRIRAHLFFSFFLFHQKLRWIY